MAVLGWVGGGGKHRLEWGGSGACWKVGTAGGGDFWGENAR